MRAAWPDWSLRRKKFSRPVDLFPGGRPRAPAAVPGPARAPAPHRTSAARDLLAGVRDGGEIFGTTTHHASGMVERIETAPAVRVIIVPYC